MLSLILLLLLQPLTSSPSLTHTTSFVAFGADTNSNPPMVFGGKLFSEMDRTAAICMRRLMYNSVAKAYVTKSASIQYRRPAYVGELFFVTAKVTAASETDVTMSVTIERENPPGTRRQERELVTKGEFVFTAFDTKDQVAVPHGIQLPSEKR